MREVSLEMRKFREISRHLWNSYLMPNRHILRLDVEDSFNIIERELLRCLVLNEDEGAADEYRKKPIQSLVIRPAKDLSEVLVRVAQRDDNNNFLWNEERNYSSNDFPDIIFFDFFDWDHYDSIDYGFVRAVEVKTKSLMLVSQDSCSFWLCHQAA